MYHFYGITRERGTRCCASVPRKVRRGGGTYYLTDARGVRVYSSETYYKIYYTVIK
jgi:hypothetical protein